MSGVAVTVRRFSCKSRVPEPDFPRPEPEFYQQQLCSMNSGANSAIVALCDRGRRKSRLFLPTRFLGWFGDLHIRFEQKALRCSSMMLSFMAFDPRRCSLQMWQMIVVDTPKTGANLLIGFDQTSSESFRLKYVP